MIYNLNIAIDSMGKFLTGQLQSTKKPKDYIRGNLVVEWGNLVALEIPYKEKF